MQLITAKYFKKDCFIKVYLQMAKYNHNPSTENFHKCINISINVFYTLPIMLNDFIDPLCSKLC